MLAQHVNGQSHSPKTVLKSKRKTMKPHEMQLADSLETAIAPIETTTRILTLLAANLLFSGVPSLGAGTIETMLIGAIDYRLESWMRNTDEVAVIQDPDDLKYKTSWVDRSGVTVTDVPADVQAVYYDDGFVYLRTEGLASHIMGPWYGPGGVDFPNYPLDLELTAVIPRIVLPLPIKTTTPAAAIGVWVNGTAVFNMINRDFGSYWHPDALQVEGETFDPANYHSEGNGWYHAHVNPIALRSQLDDHVQGWGYYRLESGVWVLDKVVYEEMTGPAEHSPILGWAFDGIPIYGPYGYSNPTNASSGVTRMQSGYVLRDGSTKGVDDIRGKRRTSLPRWAALAEGLTSLYSPWPSSTVSLDKASWGPTVSSWGGPVVSSNCLGYYIEDWQYRGDVSGAGTKGVDWDLDRYNCRWCVTPEFPKGTYAYFTTITDTGTPAFPYTLGRQYFGAVFGEIGWGADAPEIPAGATLYTGPVSLPGPTVPSLALP
jgi:hypothetical protein